MRRVASRDSKLDLIKTIAIFCVITIHVTSYGWSMFPTGSFSWVSNMFWASITRAAVPLFLMCSGVIFLNPDKELTLKKLYTKYLPRVIAAMLVWAMAYKTGNLITEGNFSLNGLWKAFKEVIVFKQEFHLYYIHLIILGYICLPIVRIITAKASKRQLEYCLAVWFAFGILYPTFGSFWPLSLLASSPRLWLITMPYAAIGYMVLGYYIRYVSSLKRLHYLILLGAGFLFVFYGTWFMCVRKGEFFENFLGGMSVGVAIMAAGIFGVCPDKKSRITTWCSKASFCIYLVHVFFLRFINTEGLIGSMLIPAVSVPLITGIIFLCSTGVYWFLSYVPGVKKWLI